MTATRLAILAASFRRPSDRALGALALVGTNALWGSSMIATKLVVADIPPLTLSFVRFGIALAVLWPLAVRFAGRPAGGRVVAMLGLGLALVGALQNVALVHATAANTALIQGAIPVLTALLAAAVLRERLGQRRLAGIVVSLAGVAALVLLGSGVGLSASVFASLLPLVSALTIAANLVLGRRACAAGNSLAVIAGSTRYAVLLLLPAAGAELAVVGMERPDGRSTLLLLYLGVACSAVAYALMTYGLSRVEAVQAAVFGNLKPLVGVVLAALVLAEPITAVQLGSGAVVLAGVWLATSAGTARVPRHLTYRRDGVPRVRRRLPGVRFRAAGDDRMRIGTPLQGMPHPASAAGGSIPHAL
jgi:drug/metabolite transporter (DMT)-like permease